MPDWSYHGIFKPLLSKLPPTVSREFIHRGMSTIASLPFGIGSHIINFLGREESSTYLKKDIDRIVFSNPVGLSGKIDPLLSGTKAFTNLGFGFLEIGPVTVSETDIFTSPIVDKNKQKIYFPSIAESIGLEKTIKKLKKVRQKQPVFIRLTGTKDELVSMLQALDSYADAFIIESHLPDLVSETTKPIYLATSKVNDEIMKSPYTGIVLEHADNFASFIEEINNLRKNGYPNTIITSGGIFEPEQALQLLDAGANLVMLSDGYVFAGPGLTKRINEALVDRLEMSIPPQAGWFSYWLFGLFIMLGGMLAFLFSITTIILPYDESFLNMERQALWAFNERIMLFMAHDRMTLAGTMISGGIVYMQLAKYGVKRGLRWAKQAIDIAAIIGFLGILAFIGYGYFDWLHLIFWIVLLPFYIDGFRKTRGIRGTPSSKNRRNNKTFKRGIYGQLAFVLLGFSFVLGGIIISIIGVTSIFVPTDLLYICMTPEMMKDFNENLLPVLAHDRAGFGSALLSVGLLVLTMSLWGYQQGNRWVWWTYLVGGLPAFYAGIYIHFAIGYTTFIHLLPAYFALGLFLIGLVLSYRFLTKQK
ncbi:beta/alpha barrel domain-containing protein [Ornithinibacillus californiensis]|uniref:dihydroorotate dehydrogenase n=1 Tax=Ornithinibacillus californiensis TaxID=161536 RepID=UPI00064DCB08|nr:dihydroorotate dehydrogenase [Ornithinibacillus californiensis]